MSLDMLCRPCSIATLDVTALPAKKSKTTDPSNDKLLIKLGHDNYFVIGASVDRSKIGFLGNSELGFIYPDLFVGPNAAIPGTGEIIHTAGNLGFSPVS